MPPTDDTDHWQILVNRLGWSDEALTLGVRAHFCCDLLGSVDDYDSWQIDHIQPVSRGGADTIDNKAVACRTCNKLKRHTVAKDVPTVASREEVLASYRVVIMKRRAKKERLLREVRARAEALRAKEMR